MALTVLWLKILCDLFSGEDMCLLIRKTFFLRFATERWVEPNDCSCSSSGVICCKFVLCIAVLLYNHIFSVLLGNLVLIV